MYMFASKHSMFRVLWVGLVSYRRRLFKFCHFWVGCSWRQILKITLLRTLCWILNKKMSPASLWLLSGHSLSLQKSSNPDKSSSSEIIKVHRVRTESWILTKVLKFIQTWKKPGKNEKNVLSFFYKPQQVLYIVIFFFKSYSISPVCWQGTMKKALFLHLFGKTLSM